MLTLWVTMLTCEYIVSSYMRHLMQTLHSFHKVHEIRPFHKVHSLLTVWTMQHDWKQKQGEGEHFRQLRSWPSPLIRKFIPLLTPQVSTPSPHLHPHKLDQYCIQMYAWFRVYTMQDMTLEPDSWEEAKGKWETGKWEICSSDSESEANEKQANPTHSSPPALLFPPSASWSLLYDCWICTTGIYSEPKLSSPNVHRNAPHPFQRQLSHLFIHGSNSSLQKESINRFATFMHLLCSVLSVIEGSGSWLFPGTRD